MIERDGWSGCLGQPVSIQSNPVQSNLPNPTPSHAIGMTSGPYQPIDLSFGAPSSVSRFDVAHTVEEISVDLSDASFTLDPRCCFPKWHISLHCQRNGCSCAKMLFSDWLQLQESCGCDGKSPLWGLRAVTAPVAEQLFAGRQTDKRSLT